jgi:diguanylate cyclase (GGDEF)-like protein/PAS domain S-box-containing protein
MPRRPGEAERPLSSDSPPPGDTSTEISGVIKALRQADQRLEELTGGRVDTVSDRDGRSYLLRRAQDQLRESEAAKQAAILNALPALIVMLDAQGLIVSANDAWRQPTGGAGLQGLAYSIGRNYLEVCDAARGEDSADAHRVAAGIRAVLSGESPRFSIEYACEMPAERRWFLLTVVPLGARRRSGAVVMHVDITDQKRSEESLRQFAAAMDATPDAIFLVDRPSMRFVHVNEAACRLLAQTRSGLLAMTPAQAFATPQEDLEQTYDTLITRSMDAQPAEVRERHRDGSMVWSESRRHAQRSGDRWTIVTLVRDITERKEAETRIIHLSRVHAMLSGINTLIVRVRNRDDLFTEACRLATQEGGFRMIWIGIIDPAKTRIIPVASIGADEAFLSFIRDQFSLLPGMPFGDTMTARAIRERRPKVANDLQAGADVLFGARHLEAGIRSMAIFPLIVGDDVVGVVGLYADENQFFHEGELKLLTELIRDIAFAIDHIEKQDKLDYIAYYDVLTGLANRSLFLERTSQHIRTARAAGRKLAVYMIDLERFKNINDSLGRPAGDSLLKQVAEWLTRSVGDANLLAHLGADHFGVVLPGVERVGDISGLLEKTMQSFLGHPFRLNDAVFRISAKIGVAVFPDDGVDADTLLKNAESALKKAKESGSRYLSYAQKMTSSVAGRLTLENQLRQALERNEFVLHYQPKINLVSGEVTGAEALLRWNDPRTGLVPPGQFIPILEETGLIHDVGRWALGAAIAEHRRWCDTGLRAVRIAVNVSPIQLRNPEFVNEIRQAIGTGAGATDCLELELTESLIMADITHSIASLRAIRALGVRIAIDDFGTGFSSLSYLARLPVNTLKIDRSFVIDMGVGPEGLALVSTIVNLAHSLKLNVVAEGVETSEQARLLRLLNCDEMQGYLFSRPVPIEIFEANFLAPRPQPGPGPHRVV